MSGGPSEESLQKARAWCAKEFAKRHERNEHASFLAAKVLNEADAKFSLESFGVEGWCDKGGKNGVDYLNMGDTYTRTLVVRTGPRHARFSVGCWGDAA